MFTPNIIGGLILGYLWKFIFNFGLTAFGKSGGIAWLEKSWLTSSAYAMAAMIIVASWQYFAIWCYFFNVFVYEFWH